MPNDAYTLSYIADELRRTLTDAKVNKAVQPERDEIVLFLYRTGMGTKRLLLSANAALPRCHITEHAKENPIAAPPFVMALRKYLIGATLTDVCNDPSERIISFRFLCKTDLKDEETRTLHAELMGKYSNLILTDGKGKILSAIKTASLDTGSVRHIFPGLTYEPPKPSLRMTLWQEQELRELLAQNPTVPPVKLLTSFVAGIATATAEEIVYRAIGNNSPESLSPLQQQAIAEQASAFASRAEYAPCLSKYSERLTDCFAFPYRCRANEFIPYESVNAALDVFYYQSDKQKRFSERSRELQQKVKSQLSKQTKKLSLQRQQLLDTEKAEKMRLYGELITANLYRIRQGDKKLIAQNYYEEDCPDVEITLDERLSPAQNAQSYYKKYAKMRAAAEYLTKSVEETSALVDYLSSVLYSFSACEEPEELAEIAKELIDQGIFPKPKESKKGAKQPQKPSAPVRYEIQGFTVWAGRNNTQNDTITFAYAKPHDIWMHVKDHHGSHVLIVTDGKSVPNEVLQAAAEIAAYRSEAAQSGKTAVDYAERRYVKKPRGAKAGFVVYTDFSTAYVTPTLHSELIK